MTGCTSEAGAGRNERTEAGDPGSTTGSGEQTVGDARDAEVSDEPQDITGSVGSQDGEHNDAGSTVPQGNTLDGAWNALPQDGTQNGTGNDELQDGAQLGAGNNELQEDLENDLQNEEPQVPDTTPPVFKEYRSHLVYIGDTVSYRSGVILTDDSGEEPVLTIDSSRVNLKEAGEYPLTYTATDTAGNTSSCEVTVVVREREDITQEMLDAKADEIIEKVLGDKPRDSEALETLFKWTKKNIAYVNYFEQKDDISAAWEGLMYERGDCYVYACASKELLTRAGFKNDMIRTARHYWNLVDLGEGWYHYDTCPRRDKPYFFMWGDEQLMEYSKANGNSHDYDHLKWPDVMP